MGPIEYAATCVLGNKIQIGLDELAPDGLMAAYQRGITDVAKLVGVPPSDVLRVAPHAEVAAVVQRLRDSQPKAITAWRAIGGQFGFFDVVTALTVDGRHPDIALCLQRVSSKVKQDRELSEPLEALAADLAAWTDLVTRTRELLEDLTWLTSTLRRRVIKKVIFASVVMAILFGMTATIVTLRVTQDRLDDRLESTGACDAEKLSQDDLGWATRDQRALVAKKIEACKNDRAAEAERARVETERRRAEQKVREIREARQRECDALVGEVEKGIAADASLSDAAATTAGEQAALLTRVAKKTLAPADIGPLDPTFPCGDTGADKRLESAYVAAMTVDPFVWARNGDPSAYAQKILIERKAELPANGLLAVADNAERTAKNGLSSGDATTISRAKKLCAFAAALGVGGHRGCNTLERFHSRQ